ERDLLRAVMNGARKSHLVYLDRDFNFVRVNETYASTCGYRPEEMIGKNHFALYPHPENETIFARVRDTGEAFEVHDKPFEFPDQPDRGITYWDWTLIPVKDSGDIVVGLVFSLFETTDRKRAEEEIKRLNDTLLARNAELEFSNKELESFIYSVSHDLRAPLRHISGFADLIVKNAADDLNDKGRQYLSHIQSAAEKMSRLIDELLKLSKISRQEIHRREIDLSEIAASIIDELRENQPERSVEVDIERGLTAFADRGLIEIVLSNLLGNAWKFTAKTGHARIEFGSSRQDNKIIYYIRDNGAGFDQKYAKKMFWPFHRLHSESAFDGTGIGLAIVDRIIRSHGGTIRAEGTEGKGAAIYFSLN
ncbi:MAG TPA: ATP-binding protein, partial [Dissulfurispiraceae bacterium]|nr:ATP-binding protein [Dissulfurispiraceae bacterium]